MRAALIVALLAVTSAANAAAPKVALPGLNAVQIDAKLAGFISEQLGVELARQGVDVVTEKEIATLIGFERKKQLLGCGEDDSSCVTELGGALGADALVFGDLAKVGTRFQLTVKAMSTSTGKQLAVFSDGTNLEEDLLPLTRSAAETLAPLLAAGTNKTLAAKSPVTSTSASTGGMKSKAWIPAAVGVVLLAGGVGAELVAFSRYNELNDGTLRTRAKADELSSSGKTLQTVFAVSATAGVAALAGAAALYFLSGDSAQPTVMITPDGAAVGFVLSIP